MPGLTLLNIDREVSSTGEPLKEIREIINEISKYISTIKPGVQPARLVPLKMKLRRLQDVVGQFGTEGSIPITTKQEYIMELHPELQLLTNRLGKYGKQFAVQTQICMNFLLNHLSSTAASDPKSTVIGVSNVMAQVLSNEIKIIEIPKFDRNSNDPKYFEDFARIYNSMLTTAGLFAAPILGLPDIPISALGGWADQALEQFSTINNFVETHYDPKIFYQIDKNEKATPFDTTTDILSFYVYENEFLTALISRADILSGLEFPSGFTKNNEPITLTSTEEITILLANSIERNCDQIENYMKIINKMFSSGLIDRNEKPDDYPHLMNYRIEAKIWRNIAQLARLMIDIFRISPMMEVTSKSLRLHIGSGQRYPPADDHPPSQLNVDLHKTIVNLYEAIFEMFPKAKNNTEKFIQSSDFTKFRDYLLYIIHGIAAHDLLLQSEYAWTPWLLNELRPFLLDFAYQYNPHGSMELGILSIILGIMSGVSILIDEGKTILESVKPYLEFQIHHLLAIEIMLKLVETLEANPKIKANSLKDVIKNFMNKYEINPQSMLFQRANLYLAMLDMYKEQSEFLRKENERFVAFDPFSWIQLPRESKVDFPYMPMNTSLDNLNSN